MDEAQDAQSHEGHVVSSTAPLRRGLLIDGVLVLAFWLVATLKDEKFAYALAVLWTSKLLFDLVRLRGRSAGAPQWSANEAYITSWRRWRHGTRHTKGR
jgi:hypothetical protein